MPAATTLDDHVHTGTFRARRHHGYWQGSVVPWGDLAELQARYVGATSDAERRADGVAFDRAFRMRSSGTGDRSDRSTMRQALG